MPHLFDVQAGVSRFALRLQPADRLESLRERIVKKLNVADDVTLQYEYVDVLYLLDDHEDFDLMLERFNSEDNKEIKLVVSGPSVKQPVPEPLHGHRVPASAANNHPAPFAAHDAQSTYELATSWSAPLGHVRPKPAKSLHVVASSASSRGSDAASVSTSKTFATAKTAAPSLHAHVDAFEQFENTRGVRTFVGSIGPVENVRMMMKSGHRQCYMSRAFAQQHNFIPKDAAPGFYGFSGITNLGSWPIKVGSKTVEQQVMLVEQAYFPVVLGRSFMEKRQVKFDPLDETSVFLGDTQESIPIDVRRNSCLISRTQVVVVKTADGGVVPIP